MEVPHFHKPTVRFIGDMIYEIMVEKDIKLSSIVRALKDKATPKVAEYIYQKRYAIDPDEFFDYYESIGWIAAGQPIRSWKSKCDIWQRRMDAENS